MPIKVHIADDHGLVRAGIQSLLDRDMNIVVVGHSCDGLTAVEDVLRIRPDVVLMDIAMPGTSGLDATERILSRWPDAKIVILTMHADEEHLIAAFEVGARGYVVKGGKLQQLVKSIYEVFQGRRCFPDMIQKKLPQVSVRNQHSIREFLTRNLAEIVGAYCHDIGNRVYECATLIEIGDQEHASAACIDISSILNGLHGFVRSFYGSEELDLILSGTQVEKVIRELCAKSFRRRKVGYRCVIGREVKRMSIPRVLLQALLTPLLENAAESMQSVKGRREPVGAFVKLDVLLPERVFLIVVEDKGQGLKYPGEQLVTAAKKGKRLSTKGDDRGYGLEGVWRLTSQLKGDLRITDKVPHGARVQVEVPWPWSSLI